MYSANCSDFSEIVFGVVKLFSERVSWCEDIEIDLNRFWSFWVYFIFIFVFYCRVSKTRRTLISFEFFFPPLGFIWTTGLLTFETL